MDRPRRLVLGVGLIAGGLSVAFLSSFVAGLIECADPGGCREIRLISWPLLTAGIVLVAAGMAVAGAGRIARLLH